MSSKGQKVRVQAGTGGGIGSGRRQTVHVRAPGGALFQHGVALAADEWDGGYSVLWDTDGYGGEWGVTIPAGLGGIYLVMASGNFGYSYSDASAGWWSLYIATGDKDYLGQWQQGWRAWNVLRTGLGAKPLLYWIGALVDDDFVSLVMDDNLTGSAGWESGDIRLSAFRLGAADEESFHGALVYKETPYESSGTDDLVTGSVLFDTDGYDNATEGGLQIPTGLDGLYVMVSAWRFTVANMSDWGVDLPDWPFGYGFALWPLLYDNAAPYTDIPDLAVGPASQAILPGVDINDCAAGTNEVAVSAFWMGRLRAGDVVASEGICDNEAPGNPIVHNEDPAYTYLALVRIAE